MAPCPQRALQHKRPILRILILDYRLDKGKVTRVDDDRHWGCDSSTQGEEMVELR